LNGVSPTKSPFTILGGSDKQGVPNTYVVSPTGE
jgi:hypothetical protein